MNIKEIIFKKLNVKPNEKFKILNLNQESFYRITENLLLEIEINNSWKIINNGLSFLLNGTYTIIKIEEELAIKYAKYCGYKWMVKNKAGEVMVFTDTPVRTEKNWLKSAYVDRCNIIEIPISFIKWEDDPYYIGD